MKLSNTACSQHTQRKEADEHERRGHISQAHNPSTYLGHVFLAQIFQLLAHVFDCELGVHHRILSEGQQEREVGEAQRVQTAKGTHKYKNQQHSRHAHHIEHTSFQTQLRPVRLTFKPANGSIFNNLPQRASKKVG
jgi:hypothetical protein